MFIYAREINDRNAEKVRKEGRASVTQGDSQAAQF